MAMEKYSVEQDEQGNYYLVARYPLHDPRASKSGKTAIIAETDSRFEATGLQYGDKEISHSGIWLIPA
jgi:hypothetical protein